MMQKVIITGADGFLGSNVTRALLQEGTEVYAVVHPDSPTRSRLKAAEGLHVIVSDLPGLREQTELLPETPDAFYHFAWQGVNALERDDFNVQLPNIDLCMESLRLASYLHARKFILPGSTYEYLYCGMPVNKNAVPTPRNAYGSVKTALRYIAAEYAKQLGVPFVYAVITGIYAADRRDNNVIFYVIDKLLKKERPSVTRLEQRWDYVHIRDAVRCLILIGEKGKDDAFYAIGHGDNQPLSEYIEVIHQYIDPTLPIGIGEIPYASDELPMSCIDLTAVKRDTGYEPSVDFREGIAEIIDRMRKEYEEAAE